jgi:hypothetical protein
VSKNRVCTLIPTRPIAMLINLSINQRSFLPLLALIGRLFRHLDPSFRQQRPIPIPYISARPISLTIPPIPSFVCLTEATHRRCTISCTAGDRESKW